MLGEKIRKIQETSQQALSKGRQEIWNEEWQVRGKSTKKILTDIQKES